MTRSHLRTVCVLVLATFLLLFGSANSQRAVSQADGNEDKVRELEDKVDTLESEVQELKAKTERLAQELSFRRR